MRGSFFAVIKLIIGASNKISFFHTRESTRSVLLLFPRRDSTCIHALGLISVVHLDLAIIWWEPHRADITSKDLF